MKSRVLKVWSAGCIALLVTGVVNAADQGNLVVTLSAHKTVVSADGKEILVPADQARPGDIIEYKAVYKNTGKSGAQNLEATLPVPVGGMEYLPHTAYPKPVKASVDGRKFEPVPLKHSVTLPDGKQELREVPYSEYRYLRWELGELSPGKSTWVSARARLNPVGTAPVNLKNQGDKQ